MATTVRLGLDTPIRRLSPAEQRQMRRVAEAGALHRARLDRDRHPDGGTEGPRWWPSDAERQECCSFVRTPSRAFPWTLMQHCRTAEHVAALTGTDAALVAQVARLLAKTSDSTALMTVVEKYGIDVAVLVEKSAMPASEVLRRRKVTRRILRDAVAPVADAAA